MSNQFNSVAEINAEKESWRIMVRVVRLWMVSDVSTQKQTSASKIPFSMEMVLVDSKGDRVHGSVKRTLIYKFENSLQEGKVYSIQFFGVADNGGIYRTTHHKYKIVFQYPTKVALVDNATIPDSLYDFVPIRDIVGGGYDSDYLVDVMGILTGVGTERENEKNGRKTKMNVIQIEADGFSIECTLFGPFVDELNAFLASGEVENAAVIVHLAKVKCFQDKIHLQNCIYGTRVLFKAECEKVKQFAKRMLESPSQGLSQLTDSAALSMSDDFLYNTPKKTIADLKDCFEDTSYAVFGTVKHVVDDEEWWYTACTCNKSVYPDSKMFFCEKCNKHVTNVVLREVLVELFQRKLLIWLISLSSLKLRFRMHATPSLRNLLESKKFVVIYLSSSCSKKVWLITHL